MAGATMSLVTLLLILPICAIQGSDTCKVTFKKVGCYSDSFTNRRLPDLLVTDRDRTHLNYGKEFNWNDFEGSVRSLLCRCSDYARRKGYHYIAIQYFAECWGSKTTDFDFSHGSSTNCMQSYSTLGEEVCNFDLPSDCAGMVLSNFVYDLLDCWDMIDIAVLFDVSTSMQGNALTAGKELLKKLVDSLKISRHGTHIGLITFSKTASIEFDFKSPLNNGGNSNGLKEVIDNIASPGGSTWPDKAFHLADTSLFTKEGGGRQDVPKFVITITDGSVHQNSVIYPIMYSLKFNKGVNLLSVGVGTLTEEMQKEVESLAFNIPDNTFDGNLGDAAESVYSRLESKAQEECDIQN